MKLIIAIIPPEQLPAVRAKLSESGACLMSVSQVHGDDRERAMAENVRVIGSHCGLGHNPRALTVIADRLAQPMGEWMPFSPIRIVSVEEFCRLRSESDVVTGPGVKKIDPFVISTSWKIDESIVRPCAKVIAGIGESQIQSAPGDLPPDATDYWRASPFYLRLSAAEEKRASMATKDTH